MGKTGKFSVSGLKQLQRQLQEVQASDTDAFMEECAKELAARLLAKVKKRTPVGVYRKSSGKKGGTLRRGWTIGEIRKEDGVYQVEVINPVEYASYVEYGHRTASHKGWVPGQFMLTVSEQELQEIAPKVLEAKIKKFLTEIME